MKNIAFDVKGTIEGPHKSKVLRLFKALEAQGHKMFVWSNAYGYAIDAVKDNALNAEAMPKFGRGDLIEREPMDLAIEDDTSQTWLGAKKIIFVHTIPDDVETFAKSIFEE